MTVAARAAGPTRPLPISLPISGVVITRDAAARIGATLESIDFCAERLVLDSGSTDGTVEAARAAGGRVEVQPFLGYGPQKRAAVALARHDWILSLDADEVLDDEARAACERLDLSDPEACWAIRRRTFVGRREIRHGPWGNDLVVRLFNRTTADFKPLPVHEEVAHRRPARLLPGSILHHGFTDCRDVLERSLRYAPLKAGIMRSKGERAATWLLPFRGLAAFAKSYVVRGGWRDGAAGFVIAVARVVDSTLPRALLLSEEEEAATPPQAGAAPPAPPPRQPPAV